MTQAVRSWHRSGCFRSSDRLAGWDSHPLEIAVFHGVLSFDTRHVRQRRRVDTPAAVTMSISIVAGSGMVAFARAPAPLPGGRPKWDRHTV
jgi:hypothetical protein